MKICDFCGGKHKKGTWWCKSYNPLIGCSHISPGCDHCWAEAMVKRFDFWTANESMRWDGTIYGHEDIFSKPMHWRKPRRVFVCSMGDLFHETVKNEWISQVMKTIEACPQHTFSVLTKRPERMLTFFDNYDIPANLWLGVSVENSNYLSRIEKLCTLRIIGKDEPHLFVSFEPLLGWVQNKNYLKALFHTLDWVIVGCESGPKARPMELDWVREIRDACIAASIPFFFKQTRVNGKIVHLPSLDGHVWAEIP